MGKDKTELVRGFYQGTNPPLNGGGRFVTNEDGAGKRRLEPRGKASGEL